MNIQNSSKKKDEESSKKIFSLESEHDLIKIRKYGRELAKEIGFKAIDQTLITAAISEICRNVIEYAGYGEVRFEVKDINGITCYIITVKDEGPGIENLEAALREGFSSGEGLGIGLPGTKRLMDEFNIKSSPGKGTTVEMYKYLKQ